MRTRTHGRERRRRRIRAVLGGSAVTAALLASCTVLPGDPDGPEGGPAGPGRPGGAGGPGRSPSPPAPPSPQAPPPYPGSAGRSMGAFLSSGPEGVRSIRGLQSWLGGTDVRVGRTYLPGDLWSNIEGRPDFLAPWARWRRDDPRRLFALNVPMQEHNEEHLPDGRVRGLLREGAAGRFDGHFRTLAAHLVRQRLADTVVVLGWEMNGTTYTHRCAPDPRAWKAYWRHIVRAMRSVPGQRFRFDFAPSRGRDAIGWTACYPGDDVVDVVGMDAYDQPKGASFDDQVHEPYGLQAQVDFAARHHKRVSYPEWGLFQNGDDPEYVRRMLDWTGRHRALYQTLTDYCPHGVWQCRKNPRSSETYRALLFGLPRQPRQPEPPRPSKPPRSSHSAQPPQPPRSPQPPQRSEAPGAPGAAGRHWWQRCWRVGDYCVRFDWPPHWGG